MGQVGNITTYVDYQDAINSEPANQRFIGRFPPGVYLGADLSIISNTTVAVSSFDIEFYDGTTRIKATSSASNNVTVSTVNVWVVARWSYTGTSNDVPSLLGVSATLTNDVILGKCIYAGSTLTGFDLSSRNDAQTFEKFCRVEQTGTASMQVKVRSGNITTGTTSYAIVEQLTSAFVAPVSNPRIDVVTINGSGQVVVIKGSENTSPSAPALGGSIPLAQILLQTSTTSITSSMITDFRGWLNTISNPSSVYVTINQVAHGFSVGQPLILQSPSFVLAQANSYQNAIVIGIVSSVIDANDFTLTLSGYVTGMSGLTAGTLYYLSGASAGALTSTNPAVSGYISLPIFFADSSTSGYFLRNTPVGSLLRTVSTGLSSNTSYQAATDGFVFGYVNSQAGDGGNQQSGAYIYLSTTSPVNSSPYLTVQCYQYISGGATSRSQSGFCLPVAKGEYYGGFPFGPDSSYVSLNFRPMGS